MGNIGDLYNGAFDTNSVEPATGFEPMPAGWYTVVVESAELKDTKAGTGKYLKLKMTVLGEDYNGRKLFPMINIVNPNEKAVEIGMRELAALGKACDLEHIDDTDDFLGHTIDVRVKIEKARDGYDPQNNVTGYRACGTGDKKEAKPAAAASGAKRPWEK